MLADYLFNKSFYYINMFKSFWYYGLLKPPLTPPDWVFLPVWSVLYFTMFAAALLYIFKPAENKEIGYVCFILQLMFNSGFRPAVNPGLSVSRVGGSAQIKAMKKIAGPIRIELAQYRELAAFSQFGSDLDADTRRQLDQGERIREILKQDQYAPQPVWYQVIIIYAATKQYLLDIPVEDILAFEKGLFAFVDEKYPEVPASIRDEKEITEDTEKKLIQAIEEFKKEFVSEQ